MKLTKEDYMKLSKERLAELLVEKDINITTTYIPYSQVVPCYALDGICTNPQMDCINCPKLHGGGGKYVTTTTSASTDEIKD